MRPVRDLDTGVYTYTYNTYNESGKFELSYKSVIVRTLATNQLFIPPAQA